MENNTNIDNLKELFKDFSYKRQLMQTPESFESIYSKIKPREFILIADEKTIKEAIRERLKTELFNKINGGHIRQTDLSKEHLRFDMSGYGVEEYGSYMRNLDILKLFADFGIWDYVAYVYLDAYKGIMTLYWKWWNAPNGVEDGNFSTEDEFSGYTTTEIIYEIIKKLSIEPRKENWKPRRFF